MSAFYAAIAGGDPRPLDASVIAEVCADAFAERNFARPGDGFAFRLAFTEEPYWELFLGHALDHPRTRERQQFTAWALFDGADDEPLLAIRWDAAGGFAHVTRSILSRVTEGYDAGGGVFESREIVRRVRELVGTVDLSAIATAGRLRDRLAELLLLGVVGMSRLPLTSVDGPLPEFSLGKLAYAYRPVADPLPELDRAKRLEFAIRSTPVEQIAAAAVGRCWGTFASDFRAMFDAVSLSPWTDFVPKVLSWLQCADGPAGTRRYVLLARLAVQIARHLNAYDLVTFHHFGANYPDALLIGECLRELLTAPTEARNEIWRSGVRAGALVAAEYTGHLVPDAPTSQGEASRVLPSEFTAVPESQIATPHLRTRRLFEDDTLFSTPAIRECFTELERPGALVELGTALYIDRPLGVGKVPGEFDHTWLGSHVLFSRTLAEKRLRRLMKRPHLLPDADAVDRWRRLLEQTIVPGVPLERRDASIRPGIATLLDAFMVADDFVFLRTTRRTVSDFAAHYDCAPIASVLPLDEWHIIEPTVADDRCLLTLYDRERQPRVRLEADLSRGFVRAGGTEYVAAGFRVVGDETTVLHAHSS